MLDRSALTSRTTPMPDIPAHLTDLVDRIRAAPVAHAPPPWRLVSVHSVGGLESVGFGRGTDLLLVVSSQGRGVFDCLTGARVARDDTMPDDGSPEWDDTAELEALGIGPLEGNVVRTAGLYGGGLAVVTRDGWTLDRFVLDWPEESIVLTGPDSYIYETQPGRSSAFSKLEQAAEVRAFGFSPTGQSIVVATTSDVTIYSRSRP